jgi:hypothetical protein
MTANTSLRIHCRSLGEAEELALRLEADGHRVSRRLRQVSVRTASEQAAEELARKLAVPSRRGRAFHWRPVAVGR